VTEPNENAEKHLWVRTLAKHGADRDALRRLVDYDHDEAETEYYEAASDPRYMLVERLQRRYRAMYRRRLRHRRDGWPVTPGSLLVTHAPGP